MYAVIIYELCHVISEQALSPNAKKIRDDLEYIKDEIVPIEGEFGEESVFEELEEKLNELESI